MTALLTTQQLNLQIAHQLICRNFDFNMYAGETIGFLGPNGFGKTTLLHTLAGFIKPISGTILIEGKNIFNQSARELAKKRGVLFQQTHAAFPRTVYEYCMSGRYPHQKAFFHASRHDDEKVRHALQVMELDNRLQQNVQTLSGGELRRLAIATVLAQAPHIYLLDEPLNHLDPRHQMNVFTHLKKLAKEEGASILMTLHDPYMLRHHCSHVLLPMEHGTLLKDSPAKILTAENLSYVYNIPLKEMRGSLWQYGY
ncbi:MAG: ABC transporter ATP-binding protein [Gammaproteobacteria bacterium]|nr:ABC transporter ATP-binding protein [Gammaproteobacteria bacterium]